MQDDHSHNSHNHSRPNLQSHLNDSHNYYEQSLRFDDDNDSGTNFMEELQSLGESFVDAAGGVVVGVTGADENVPDIMLLNLYCARAKPPKEGGEEGAGGGMSQGHHGGLGTHTSHHNGGTSHHKQQSPQELAKTEAEMSWQPVRQWLSTHSAEQVRAAAEQKGESGLTALHFACRHVPPLDIIDVFLSIAADTVRWTDAFGWLPIHYACASGSDSAVIKALAENHPESKTSVDRRGRTPLHFALGDRPAAPDVIFLLSSSGAASYADEIGMLPLHYACAFGASEEVLYVLTEAYPEAIITKDKRQRTPLHFALSNAGRKTVPSAVRLLLSLNRQIANSSDNGPLPLRVLAEYSHTVKKEDEKKEEKQDSVFRCLEYLLNAEPDPTADFLTALQSLPDWLSERAVVMPVVQMMLNEKIARRFPTAVLMLDFYVIAITIVFYGVNVVESINRRSMYDTPEEIALPAAQLFPLYLGAIFFAVREIVQIISLISLKSFNIWLYDPSNYLNVLFVFLILFWSIRMTNGTGQLANFRIGATISVVVIWVKLLAYLRNVMIDFAVFVGGVFYVVRRLAAFLTALAIILIAFGQMFFTVFQQTNYCTDQPNTGLSYAIIVEDTKCDGNQLRPYCNFWTSFMNVYTMLLGEVDEQAFAESGILGIILFVLFVFLVVILLGNVLIAIVTDSYKVIQDQRAAIVFWTNRLDFIAEMDGVAYGPWKNRLRTAIGLTPGKDSSGKSGRSVFGKELWKTVTDLFVDSVEEGMFSLEFVAYTMIRILAMIFIPLWIVVGMLTAGWLWPPQMREAVFTSRIQKHSSEEERQSEQRKTQVKRLQQEVKELHGEIMQELALDRTQVVQLKSHIAERKMEISSEMRDVKRIVALLFERQPQYQI